MDIHHLLEKTLLGLGYELVDVAFTEGGNLCVFVDRQPHGVTINDCTLISQHLTHLLTVENVAYKRLEVSSPGLDRPLKTLADFVRSIGKLIYIKTHVILAEKNKKCIGRLMGVENGILHMNVDQKTVAIALADIRKARLEPEVQITKNTQDLGDGI